MLLDFADYRHHYDVLGLSEQDSRAHFDAMHLILDAFVLDALSPGVMSNPLGISFRDDTDDGDDPVEWTDPITPKFNRASPLELPGRKEA